MPLLPFLLLALQAAAPMPMDKPEPVCIRAGDLPPAFARWNAAPAARLGIGVPFVMTATAPTEVRWAMPATRPGKGAVASFTIARAGIYRIGLSNSAWIDVVKRGKPVASVAHGHGPLCTGLRKIVDFRLARGSYTLQLADMAAPETRVMVIRKQKVTD